MEHDPFKVYPNPTDNIVYFSFEKASIVQLYNDAGKMIWSQKYEAGNVIININGHPVGLYLVQKMKIVASKTEKFCTFVNY